MNGHYAQSPESDSELRNLAAVMWNIISPAKNSSIIGIFQDSLLGAYQFTRKGIKFSARDAMNLLMMNKKTNEIDLLEKLEKNNGFLTNFDILSQIMPPLSLKYKLKSFKEDKDDFATSNSVLEIRNGEYIRGQLDKSAFAAGTKGLLQRICNDFGNQASADFIDNIQNVVTEYMKSSAFSVGISDLISDQKTNDEIVKVITNKKQEVKNLLDQVQLGIFENNTGKTNQEEFETQVNSILNQATSESGKIGLNSLGKDNRFVIMVNAGSKGSELNISFMISCLGQQNVDGKRIPNGFEHRTLPHFTKYDDSPSARGFVESSYINGLTPQELFFHAMGGRVGLIDTAVKSVTWETPIIIIENNQPKYTEIGRWIDSYLDNQVNKDKIKHYTDRQMELLDVNNIYIPTTDENGVVTWGEITALTRHDPGDELFEIKTSGGRSVIVTESKSLLVWNPEKKQFIEKYTPEIKVGDYVPVTGELCEPPKESMKTFVYMDAEQTQKFEFTEHNMIQFGHYFNSQTQTDHVSEDCIELYLLEFFNNWATHNGSKIIPDDLLLASSDVIETFIWTIIHADHEKTDTDKIYWITNNQWSEIEYNKILYLLSRVNLYGKLQTINENKYIWVTRMQDNEFSYNVVLDEILEINKVDVKNYPKVYDLTIPSTLNFGLANGLQVRDTSQTGYIQRRLIKGLEDLKVEYDMTVRTNKNKIVQFKYGDDNIDTIKVENQSIPIVTMSTQDIYAHFLIPDDKSKKGISNIFPKNALARFRKQNIDFLKKTEDRVQFMIEMREKIIKNVFKNKGDSVVNCPVAFSYIINNVQGQCGLSGSSLVDITPLEAIEMIDHTYLNLEKIHYAPPTVLWKVLYYYYLSPKDLLIIKRFNKAALTMLLDMITLYYKRSIVAPGEMVGMIAGQSIGEISTQMSALSSEKMKIISKNKNTSVVQFISTEIGPFIDNLMLKLPEYTFNTGHNADSFETLLETLDEEYYIVGVTEDEKTKWNKISHISRHPVNGDIMKVTTRSGRVVETTTSHSHLVRCAKTQKVVPIVGANMVKGMRIPVAKHIDNDFIKDTIQIDNKDYKLDYLFGWFLGAYLSEGNITNNQICITNVSEVFINNTTTFAELFDKDTTVRTYKGEYGPSTCTKFNHKGVAQLLLNTCGTGSFVKRVPDFAFTAPNEFKAGLIQAYFDGDGNFQNDKNHHQIRVCSRSKQLIKDIALLLNYFDISSSLKENFVRGSTIYNCYVSSKYSIQYRKCIGSMLHIEILNEICNYIEREGFHKIPDYIDKINGVGHIVADCGKILKLPGQSRNYGCYRTKESIGRQTLEKYIQVFASHPESHKIHSELQILQQAVTSNVIWDEIVNIEVSTPDPDIFVYDFTVPGNQTFMTDYGVIVHNTLNTFHFAGVASKSNVTRGVPRIEEILALSSEIKNPSLSVYLNPEDETQKEKAHSIMYMLEHTKLEEIVKSVEICFDPDDLNTYIEEDKDTIMQYKFFENMVAECSEASLQNDDNEKSKWILRMIMDPEIMLEKNITMDDVNFALKNCYETQISCIYSDYNADKLIFRIRMNEVLKSTTGRGQKKPKISPLDQSDQIYILKNFQDQLLQNIVLRGVKGIDKVILRKVMDNVVENNGLYKKQDIWVLDTIGTNLLDVLALDYIDNTRTISNDIVEIYNVLGIEAARQAIYNELVEVVEFDGTYVNYHNYSVLVDRMTFTHKLISIFRHGINNDNIGPIAKASFEETPEMFLKAARHAELDTMKGISANVMCGQEGFYGTSAFQVLLDTDEYMKLEEASEYKPVNMEKEIENMFSSSNANATDSCSIDKIAIQTNVVSIKAKDFGKDDSYNPGF